MHKIHISLRISALLPFDDSVNNLHTPPYQNRNFGWLFR
jgi:hypothetical protein